MVNSCFFELNDRPLSNFVIGANRFPAYSGYGEYINKRNSACQTKGAIPPGEYIIIDRESGGSIAGRLWDWGRGKNEWFSLLANDGHIDDIFFCDGQKRDAFRLHPKGSGVSYGCIAINNDLDFNKLATMLRRGPSKQVAKADGSLVTVWATLVVK